MCHLHQSVYPNKSNYRQTLVWPAGRTARAGVSQITTKPLEDLMSVRQWLRRASQASFVLVAVTLMVVTNVMASGADATRRARGAPTAVVAGERSLNLTAHLRLIGRPGHKLTEQGRISGTFSGTATIHFTSITSTSGEATCVFYPPDGSISGRVNTHSHVVGATAYFAGTLSITGGTGKWAHSSGAGLRFSGSLERHTFHAIAHVSGNVRQ
jgi:hypothetical protein